MKIIYGKTLSDEENRIVGQIAFECGILFDTARLLFYRNIDTVAKAKKFLFAEKNDFYNPFLLGGMKEAVERIRLAKSKNEKVLVFGDYDADGICAASTLYFCCKNFGITTFVAVPEREDGYGLNVLKVKEFQEKFGVSLVITVDCGISDIDKIEEIKAMGIDVIVTDHHEPPEILPDCIKINPKLKNQEYPFDGLCGAGVAYKLGSALIGKNADDYLDLTALATVADSMDLIDENRKIVIHGLKKMNGNDVRLPFRYLAGENPREVTAQSMAFTFAPRVNAGGRMGDADSVLKMFISDDQNEIFDLAVKLNNYNLERQTGCDDIYRKAKEKIKSEELYKDSVIMVSGENWKTGFIGIVASKLVEDFNRPVIVFADCGDYYKGSARSVDGVNIYDSISFAKDYLLTFGGHSQAAGISVSKENFDVVKRLVCDFVDKNFPDGKQEKEIAVEWETEEPLTAEFVKEISMLEPFGIANKKPAFAVGVSVVNAKPLKIGSPHYSFSVKGMDFLNFNGESDLLNLALPIDKKIVFEPDLSVFRGKTYLKGIVKSVVTEYGNLSKLKLHAFRNELLKLKSEGVSEFNYAKDIKPERGMGTVYAVIDTENPAIKNTKLPVYIFSTPDKTAENCVVLSPSKISDGYKRIIYLDKPYTVSDFGTENTVCEGDCLYLNNLTGDREIFGNIYKYLLTVSGEFKGSAEWFNEHNPHFNPFEFVFATETFTELGFFRVEAGLLRKNDSVKCGLEKSEIYRKILKLKGEKC